MLRNNVIRPNFRTPAPAMSMPVAASQPLPPRAAAAGGEPAILAHAASRSVVRQQLNDLDIPTFIRRQMD
jgi:hypothetical protein